MAKLEKHLKRLEEARWKGVYHSPDFDKIGRKVVQYSTSDFSATAHQLAALLPLEKEAFTLLKDHYWICNAPSSSSNNTLMPWDTDTCQKISWYKPFNTDLPLGKQAVSFADSLEKIKDGGALVHDTAQVLSAHLHIATANPQKAISILSSFQPSSEYPLNQIQHIFLLGLATEQLHKDTQALGFYDQLVALVKDNHPKPQFKSESDTWTRWAEEGLYRACLLKLRLGSPNALECLELYLTTFDYTTPRIPAPLFPKDHTNPSISAFNTPKVASFDNLSTTASPTPAPVPTPQTLPIPSSILLSNVHLRKITILRHYFSSHLDQYVDPLSGILLPARFHSVPHLPSRQQLFSGGAGTPITPLTPSWQEFNTTTDKNQANRPISPEMKEKLLRYLDLFFQLVIATLSFPRGEDMAPEDQIRCHILEQCTIYYVKLLNTRKDITSLVKKLYKIANHTFHNLRVLRYLAHTMTRLIVGETGHDRTIIGENEHKGTQMVLSELSEGTGQHKEKVAVETEQPSASLDEIEETRACFETYIHLYTKMHNKLVEREVKRREDVLILRKRRLTISTVESSSHANTPLQPELTPKTSDAQIMLPSTPRTPGTPPNGHISQVNTPVSALANGINSRINSPTFSELAQLEEEQKNLDKGISVSIVGSETLIDYVGVIISGMRMFITRFGGNEDVLANAVQLVEKAVHHVQSNIRDPEMLASDEEKAEIMEKLEYYCATTNLAYALQVGNEAIRRASLNRALTYCKSVLEKRPNEFGYHYLAALIHAHLQNGPQALKYTDLAFHENQTYLPSANLYCLLLAADGHYAKSLTFAKQVIQEMHKRENELSWLEKEEYLDFRLTVLMLESALNGPKVAVERMQAVFRVFGKMVLNTQPSSRSSPQTTTTNSRSSSTGSSPVSSGSTLPQTTRPKVKLTLRSAELLITLWLLASAFYREMQMYTESVSCVEEARKALPFVIAACNGSSNTIFTNEDKNDDKLKDVRPFKVSSALKTIMADIGLEEALVKLGQLNKLGLMAGEKQEVVVDDEQHEVDEDAATRLQNAKDVLPSDILYAKYLTPSYLATLCLPKFASNSSSRPQTSKPTNSASISSPSTEGQQQADSLMEVIVHLHSLLAVDPHHIGVLVTLGKIYISRKEYAIAGTMFKRALSSCKAASSRVGKGLTYWASDAWAFWSEATECMSQAGTTPQPPELSTKQSTSHFSSPNAQPPAPAPSAPEEQPSFASLLSGISGINIIESVETTETSVTELENHTTNALDERARKMLLKALKAASVCSLSGIEGLSLPGLC